MWRWLSTSSIAETKARAQLHVYSPCFHGMLQGELQPYFYCTANRSRASLVCLATRRRAVESGVGIQKVPGRLWNPLSPCSMGKGPSRECNSLKLKLPYWCRRRIGCNYTSTPPTDVNGVDKENFTLFLYSYSTLNVAIHLLEPAFGIHVFLGLCLILETPVLSSLLWSVWGHLR